MLCESAAMKNTSYEQTLWNSSTSDTDIMYNDWQRTRYLDPNSGLEGAKLRLSHSLGDLRGSFPTARQSKKIQSQDYHREQTGLCNRTGSFESLKPQRPEIEDLENPRFHITIQQPIHHVTPAYNVTFPAPSNARWGRRASDGLLTASHYGGRNVRAFSVVSEEDGDEIDSGRNARALGSGRSSSETRGSNSGGSSLITRRFSVGCFHDVPAHSGIRKVSVVLPQPRNNGSTEPTGNNESESDMKRTENADVSTNEEDDRWKELVARAQGFKGSKTVKCKIIQAEDVKEDFSRSLEVELADVSDMSSEASFSSTSSHHSSGDSDTALKDALVTKPISPDLAAHINNETITNTGRAARVVRHVSVVNSSNNLRHHARRYSVATLNPSRSFQPANTVKLSGYSTQSALEQARQLLGKLQSEGKLKTKKERLEELSRALKWILEELNRIETPDRELVSLFISLRAKLVTLKRELKSEEFDATCVDPASETEDVSQTQVPVTDDSIAHARARRFSWC